MTDYPADDPRSAPDYDAAAGDEGLPPFHRAEDEAPPDEPLPPEELDRLNDMPLHQLAVEVQDAEGSRRVHLTRVLAARVYAEVSPRMAVQMEPEAAAIVIFPGDGTASVIRDNAARITGYAWTPLQRAVIGTRLRAIAYAIESEARADAEREAAQQAREAGES